MGNTWLCIPSARPPEQVEPVLAKWRERGYKIALLRDEGKNDVSCDHFESVLPYPGYAQAVNLLVSQVFAKDPDCDWIVTGGDDTLPDPNHTAEEIARECEDHFYSAIECAYPPSRPAWSEIPIPSPGGSGTNAPSFKRWATFGVMQPTGDRFAGGCIDRIAGSPWLGREWCLRANGGRGPFWPEFTHMFGDECLKRTAEKLGVYWPRTDLVHFHNHFQRVSDAIDSRAMAKPIPEHLKQWNTRAHWDEMQAIFKRLEAEEFASCMPL